MAFELENFGPCANSIGVTSQVFTYKTDDDTATVGAPGYFNEAAIDGGYNAERGDFILVDASDSRRSITLLDNGGVWEVDVNLLFTGLG